MTAPVEIRKDAHEVIRIALSASANATLLVTHYLNTFTGEESQGAAQ
jgi:hypothetical protein